MVAGVAFSADGSRLATTGGDGQVKVWDAATGTELLNLSGHTSSIWAVAFNREGSRLATASLDGTVRVFALRLEDLIALARSRVTRALTTEECQRFLHVETCPAEP
jgi:WD40 repeat protein